jgi:DNA-directed RNA polymerase specialized sigma24 family protein
VDLNGTKSGFQQQAPLELDTDELARAYVEERLSLRQVADRFGVSHSTVHKRLAARLGALRTWRLPGEK